MLVMVVGGELPLVVRELERRQIETIVVTDPGRALDVARARRPEVVVLETQSHAREAWGEMRRDLELGNVPVILIGGGGPISAGWYYQAWLQGEDVMYRECSSVSKEEVVDVVQRAIEAGARPWAGVVARRALSSIVALACGLVAIAHWVALAAGIHFSGYTVQLFYALAAPVCLLALFGPVAVNAFRRKEKLPRAMRSAVVGSMAILGLVLIIAIT